MTAPVLRDYQGRLLEELRENMRAGLHRQLLVSPTGSGKTILFSAMTQAAASKGKRIGILCHRQELISQISGALSQFEVPHAIVAPGHVVDRGCPVQVASVFALARRIDQYPPFDVLVIDEAHHAIAGSTWGKVIDATLAANPRAHILGVTATPQRLSGEGLSAFFDTMVMGPSTAELIAAGWLSDYRLFAPAGMSVDGVHTRMGDFVRAELEAAADRPTITGDAVRHYQRLAYGKRALAFCVSIRHAEHVAEQFRANAIKAARIDGTMERAARTQAIADFVDGRVQVLTSCDLVSEGFDVPAIECAILLRPTQSLALHLQQIGRSLRILPGKKEAILLDHAGNTARHGLPDQDREWTLEGARKSKRGGDAPKVAIKSCPECFAVVVAHALQCRHCGHRFQAVGREIEERDGQLVEVSAQVREVARVNARQTQGQAKTLEALISIGMSRGYKSPHAWARRVWEGRQRKAAA